MRHLLAAALLFPLPAVAQDGDVYLTPEQAAAYGYVAEPQVPTGKFTTAGEIKQLLLVTRGSWLALNEVNGQDYLYGTQVLSWRCGLAGFHISINGGPMSRWEMPPCHEGTAAPNAFTETDGLPLIAFPLGSVQTATVELVLDDLSRIVTSFQRQDILMP